jgi:hypothetical protein
MFGLRLQARREALRHDRSVLDAVTSSSWLSNFGQLRRNTDRRTHHRLAQLALAIVFLIAAKLIDWLDRWNPA